MIIQGKIQTSLILIFCVFYQTISRQYVVAYIFQDSHEQKLAKNSIKIFQMGFMQSQVKINSESRSSYINKNIFQNQTILITQKIPQGSLVHEKWPIPQHMWIQQKQLILIQVDIHSFPAQQNELIKYKSLFRHKGQSIYIFNSQQISKAQQMDIALLLDIFQQDQQICQIQFMKYDIKTNQNKIIQCYKKSKQRKRNPLIARQHIPLLQKILKYTPFATVYIIIVLLIIFGHPYYIIYKNKIELEYGSKV